MDNNRWKLHHIIPNDNRELQPDPALHRTGTIISYQMITGNYSVSCLFLVRVLIISYQMITGNYSAVVDVDAEFHHIIPNDNRELQLKLTALNLDEDHIIPNDNRELQRVSSFPFRQALSYHTK